MIRQVLRYYCKVCDRVLESAEVNECVGDILCNECDNIVEVVDDDEWEYADIWLENRRERLLKNLK